MKMVVSKFGISFSMGDPFLGSTWAFSGVKFLVVLQLCSDPSPPPRGRMLQLILSTWHLGHLPNGKGDVSGINKTWGSSYVKWKAVAVVLRKSLGFHPYALWMLVLTLLQKSWLSWRDLHRLIHCRCIANALLYPLQQTVSFKRSTHFFCGDNMLSSKQHDPKRSSVSVIWQVQWISCN